MDDISLKGVTTTESAVMHGAEFTVTEEVLIHDHEEQMSEFSLPLPPTDEELNATSIVGRSNRGYGGRPTTYADLNFEAFAKSAKTGGMKLGPTFSDLDSLDVSCHDDEDDDDDERTEKTERETAEKETGKSSANVSEKNFNTQERQVSIRDSTRNLLSESDLQESFHTEIRPSVIVRRQPSSATGLVVFPYDPQSKETLERLSTEHRSHNKLKSVINKELTKISTEADIRIQSFNGGLSYPAFLKDILFDDEFYLFNKNHLRFSSVVFHILQEVVSDSAQGQSRARIYGIKSPPKPPLLSGRAYLTNHRIILLTAEKQRGASIVPKGSQSKSDYHLKALSRDSLNYLSIPLTHIRGMELHASLGYSASANITSRHLFCGLLDSCESLLPGDVSCTKWLTRDRTSHGTNSRCVTLGVLLPPWLHPTNLSIHVSQEVSMKSVRDFMVELQHITPSLRTQPQRASTANWP